MKKLNTSLGTTITALIILFLFMPTETIAQDPAMVDSKHYKVEFENEQVRVLRISYGPGEESVMHYHPDAVAVMLTGGTTEMTDIVGSTAMVVSKAGEATWTPAGKHLPKNTGAEGIEVILVELKTKPE